MSNFVAFLLISVAVLSPGQTRPKVFDREAQIGLADFRRGQLICLTIGNGGLSANRRIYLVSASEPQRLLTAEVEKKLAASCSEAQDTAPGESFYHLRLANGGGSDVAPGEVFIALSGTAKPAMTKGRLLSVDLEGDGRREYFRSCTSREGVHLTVWSGRPPAGRRLWRRYYYLGYDVEPSCSEKEVALSGPDGI